MNEALAELQAQPLTWYQSKGMYQGSGCISSETLGKEIQGDFSVEWDDTGDCEIKCNPQNLSFTEATKIIDDFDQFRNLIIKTNEGEFTASQCYIHGTNFNQSASSVSHSLSFSTLAGIFRANNSHQPSLWNASLTNLVIDLVGRVEIARQNPLNLFHFPDIPPDFPSIEVAQLLQSSMARILSFRYAGSLAFIEHLPEFEGAKARLKGRQSTNEVTSLMVGRIPPGVESSAEGVREWFPTELLDALTLASGSRIGLGTVELRAENRTLYGRVHVAFADGRYMSGHEAISRYQSTGPNSGMEPFLERVLQSNSDAKRRFRLISAAIDLAQEASGIPDLAFALIVRALDGLANDLNLTRSNLSDELPLDMAERVRAILTDAFAKLKGLSPVENRSDTARSRTVLARIADRARSADSTEDKFSLSLGRVLANYGFEDESAMAMFYAEHPRNDGFTWGQALDKYRAGTIHYGHIDYSAGIEIMDVVCTTRHLIDLAIRISLKEVGYDGTYNPLDMTTLRQNPLDWVKSDKDIRNFGYHGMTPKMFRFIDRSEDAGGPA